MYRIWEFFFSRWKKEIIKRGSETWISRHPYLRDLDTKFSRDYVEYKLTNKFDGSQKIKRVYLT